MWISHDRQTKPKKVGFANFRGKESEPGLRTSCLGLPYRVSTPKRVREDRARDRKISWQIVPLTTIGLSPQSPPPARNVSFSLYCLGDASWHEVWRGNGEVSVMTLFLTFLFAVPFARALLTFLDVCGVIHVSGSFCHPQPPSLLILLPEPGSERKVLTKETWLSLLREYKSWKLQWERFLPWPGFP